MIHVNRNLYLMLKLTRCLKVSFVSCNLYRAPGGAIPDAATIHMARKQREKAKILLESADVSEGTHPSGRSGNRRLVK